jgi:hypothetical protein
MKKTGKNETDRIRKISLLPEYIQILEKFTLLARGIVLEKILALYYMIIEIKLILQTSN